MRAIILFQLILLTGSAFCQITWNGNKDWETITGHMEVLKDPQGKMDIAEVSSGIYDSAFYKPGKSILNFGFNDSAYWLRFSLRSNKADSLLLELEHAFIPYADLFYKMHNGSWKSVKSGYKVNLKDKIIKDHYQVFPIPAGNNDFYIRIIPYLHPVKVKLWNTNAYQLNAGRQRLTYGIYAGILIFAIAINIFLFFALNRTYYLLYAILVFLYAAASAGVMEGYMVYFFPEADMMYWYKIIPVLNMPALLLYSQSFLQVKKASPFLHRLLLYTVFSLILYIVCLHYLPVLPVLMVNQILALAVFILSIYTGIFVGKKGNKLGYYFAITYTIWFTLLCFEEIYIQFGVPPHIFDLSYVSVAIFIEAFLLAFLQAKRFQWERNADQQVKLEMQENIVELKQHFQNEIMQAQLEMQEQTFETISQEIHDNIGQTLSLIKINLNMMGSKIPQGQKERLADSKDLLSKAIHELRDLTKTLNTDYIKNIGLTMAIEHQINFIKKTGRYFVDFTVQGKAGASDLQKELLIFRIVQEMLNNTLKHANGSRIIIEMQYDKEKLKISYSDNGQGFDMNQVKDKKLEGLGLRNIIHRTELIGGSLIINSQPMLGTRMVLTVPNFSRKKVISNEDDRFFFG